MQAPRKNHPEKQLNQGQDMDIEHNTLDIRQSDPPTHHLLSPDQRQCRRTRKDWRCEGLASPGNRYGDKNRLEQDIQNERRRNARRKKGSHFLMDPVLPSGQRQCRCTGKRWRCSDLAPPQKLYCQKHELQQKARSEKKRKGQGHIGCDEMKSSGENKERCIDDVWIESSKSGCSVEHVDSGTSLFPVSEGVGDEDADNNLTISQIDFEELLCPTLEEHQAGLVDHEKPNLSVMEDNDDNQLITMESIIELPPVSKGSFGFNSTDDEAGIACSVDMQQEEAPLSLESENWSFMKTSHVWKQIESMETLKLIPQHPHFRPLENVNEEAREGKAVGYMLLFDHLMETTRRAQIDIPETVFTNKLNALTDLEEYGFTVEPLRSRLEKLRKMKNEYIQIDESSKTAKEALINEKRQFEEMKESIAQLNMELQLLSAEKEINEMKVLALQRTENEIGEKIQHVRLEFDRVVSTFGRSIGY